MFCRSSRRHRDIGKQPQTSSPTRPGPKDRDVDAAYCSRNPVTQLHGVFGGVSPMLSDSPLDEQHGHDPSMGA